MPQRLSHVEVAHRPHFCRLIWILYRAVKVESTADRPREGMMGRKNNSPEIQDVISVDAHSWLAIRVIHRSARKNITIFTNSPDTRGFPDGGADGCSDGAGAGVRLLSRRRFHSQLHLVEERSFQQRPLQLRGAARTVECAPRVRGAPVPDVSEDYVGEAQRVLFSAFMQKADLCARQPHISFV